MPQSGIPPMQQPGIVPVQGPYLMPAPPNYYPNVPAGWVAYGPDGQPQPQVVQPVPPGPPSCEAVAPGDVQWPRWTFDATALIISRDNHSRPNRIYPTLYATSPQFDAVAAPDLALGYHVDPKNEWQVRYFNVIGIEGTAHTPPGYDPEVGLRYVSNFENAEINYLHTWESLSFIAGFRYINLDEHFYDYYYNSFGNLYAINNFASQNNLFGGQVGFNFHHEWGRFVFDDTTKFGLYDNVAAQHYTNEYLGTTRTYIDNHPVGLADSLEVNLYLGYRFSPHWIGRIGFMGLTINDVALAHDVEYSNKTDGNVSLFGLSLGATAQW